LNEEKDNPKKPEPQNENADFFASAEKRQWEFFLFPLVAFGVICVVFILLVELLPKERVAVKNPSVTIYTSQDEEYSEPIFKDFEKKTGIQVKAVFDSEAVKTVGLANRLLAESSHPQCDVFWNNEELRTRLLASKNVFRETNGWVLMGCRSRRLIVNTNKLSLDQAPHNFSEATNAMWRGKFAVAYPFSGTTPTHFLALRQAWGDAGWQEWCRALAANKPFMVDGNPVVAKMVGAGEAWFGFTDSDDTAEEQADGKPVVPMPMGPETLVIHNTAGVIRGAPHPAEAQKLFEYLQTAEVQEILVKKKALESAKPGDPKDLPGLKVDWDALLKDLERGTDEMKGIFLR
jgi:iron(III) transport system substrate-binding protein